MAPHSSTLAWKIPWMEEPSRLQSMGSLRVRHDWVTSLSLFTFMHWRRKWQPTPVFLPGESQGQRSLLGCRLWGHRVRHDWSDLAAAAAATAGHSNFRVEKLDCNQFNQVIQVNIINYGTHWNHEPPDRMRWSLYPLFSLKTALVIQCVLHCHMNCENFCSSSMKNAIGNFIGIALNL